jgi:Protein of unknown function (DUF3592)
MSPAAPLPVALRMAPVPEVTFARGPRAVGLGFLLIGSVFVVSRVWHSLSWHARGMILAAYGIAFLPFALIPALRTRGRLKSGARTQGTVVGTDRQKDTGARTSYYHPVVRFTAPDGRTVEFTSAVGYQIKPDEGDPVPVRYRPDNPEQAEIDRAIAWMMPAAFGLLGGLGLLVAGVVTYLNE